MSPTHRGPNEDGAKKRQEYVRKKVSAYARAALATGICVACIAYLWSPAQISHPEHNIPPDPNRAEYLCIVITNGFYFLGPKWPSYSGAEILTLASLLVIIVVSVVHFLKQLRSVRRVTYVPPVHEQLAALPADEILLRGSEQPAARSGELLRAAHAGAETEAGELLRADQGRT
jgi:hypothetical protein